MKRQREEMIRPVCATAVAAPFAFGGAPGASGYAFDEIVPDVRQGVALSSGSACPVRAHQLSSAGSVAVQWSTALGTSPVTILTQNQTANGRVSEIEQVITQSIGEWMAVEGTTLTPAP